MRDPALDLRFLRFAIVAADQGNFWRAATTLQGRRPAAPYRQRELRHRLPVSCCSRRTDGILSNHKPQQEPLRDSVEAAFRELAARGIDQIAAFSTAEERFSEARQLGGRILFFTSEALAAAGAKGETGAKWRSQVVQDRELTIGQQPCFDDASGEVCVRALDASLALH